MVNPSNTSNAENSWTYQSEDNIQIEYDHYVASLLKDKSTEEGWQTEKLDSEAGPSSQDKYNADSEVVLNACSKSITNYYGKHKSTNGIKRVRFVDESLSDKSFKIFDVGDQVTVETLKRSRRESLSNSTWTGPYMIREIFDDGICELVAPNGDIKQHQMEHLKLSERTNWDDHDHINNYSFDDDNDVVQTSSSANSVSWIQQLNLNMHDKRIVQYGHQLNDKIIDAAQTLMKRQYDIGGLDSSLLCQTNTGYDVCGNNSVQIHFDDTRQHWVTSSTRQDRVEFCDSLFYDPKTTMSNHIKQQLVQRYQTLGNNGKLTIFILPVKQQENTRDCGVYAIANAVELLEEGDPTALYEQARMRKHLRKCLEDLMMLPFPKSSKMPRKNRGKTIQYDIDI